MNGIFGKNVLEYPALYHQGGGDSDSTIIKEIILWMYFTLKQINK